MNIVQISPYSLGRNGGVQTHVRDLAEEFRRQGHNVLCICPGETAGLPEGSQGLGRMRSISFAGTHFELSLASSAELSDFDRLLAEFRPDIMHYHTMWVPMLPWQIFRRSHYPSIATFHDTTSSDATGAMLRAIFRPLSLYLLSRLDGALTVSPAPLAHLRPGRHGVIPVVLPPAVDLDRYFSVSKPDHNEIPVVLFVGRLEPRKGITVLLDAWRKVVAASGGTRPPHLIVAGSGECAPLVAQAIDQLGVDVISHHEAPDNQTLRELLAKATIAVSPAIYGESFGIILVEALAAGTPIIGAANAGYVHVLTGKGRDLLVPPGDADALAARIMELIADPRQCRELGAWGRKHAVQFDVQQCLPRFLAAYKQAIARHNSA